MHFNDLLRCASQPGTQGITRTLRYTNPKGDLLYTIHSDDIAIWDTQSYYAVSRRLDLENTRKVEKGESAVLVGEHGYANEPMVWDVCDARFGIFELNGSAPEGEAQYQDLPPRLLSSQGQEPSAPACALVTLTYKAPSVSTLAEGEWAAPPDQLARLRDQALMAVGAGGQKVYSSMYRHRLDSQPDNHPPMMEGADGNGTWIVCIFVEGILDDGLRTQLHSDDVKVGFWKGEVFMC